MEESFFKFHFACLQEKSYSIFYLKFKIMILVTEGSMVLVLLHISCFDGHKQNLQVP